MDCFRKRCLPGTPSGNRLVEIFGIGWPGVIGLTRNESLWEVIPEVFKYSVRERGATSEILKVSLFLQKLLPKKNTDIFVGHPVYRKKFKMFY